MFTYPIEQDLALKLIDIRDAEAIFELTNQSRDYLREWLPWLDHSIKLEDTRNYIQNCLKGFSENKSLHMVILFKGEIVGVASFNELNWSNKTAYIGYWLSKDYQGRGIMTKVAKALTDYAFVQLQVNKVEIRAAVENMKSRRIPERLGYIQEGTIRNAEWLYDHFVDIVIYGALANEWLKKR